MTFSVSLSQFIDFTNSMGARRISIAKSVLDQTYDPKTDFYRPLRKAIDGFHRGGEKHDQILTALPGQLSDDKKRSGYPSLIASYLRWVRLHRVRRIGNAPKWNWDANGLDVNINPELAVEVDGKPHVVKLWLRTEKIDRHRLPATLAMMHQSLGADESVRIAVLDVRRKRLHVHSTSKPDTLILLRNEARAFAGMLEDLRAL